jgi:hypothetical protein
MAGGVKGEGVRGESATERQFERRGVKAARNDGARGVKKDPSTKEQQISGCPRNPLHSVRPVRPGRLLLTVSNT